MAIKYLITGATGNLGGQILEHLIRIVPKSEVGAASSNASKKAFFEDLEVSFRHLDFDNPQSLVEGLDGVENLLFVSTGSRKRAEQHGNIIKAAEAAKVKHVWYTSLAYGGLSNDSKISVQQDHLLTERLLKESGLVWTSIREGVYAEAFDILIDWYPSKKVVKLPADGEIAFTSRAELAEATARLLVGQGFEREIVLLTTQGTIRPKDIVDIINETTGRQVEFELVTEEVYLHAASEDQRDKPREWYEQLAAWWKAFSQGDARSTHPLMRDVLGREPMTPREAIKSLLSKNRDYSYT